MTVKIDPRALNAVLTSPRGPVGREIAKIGEEVAVRARKRVGYDASRTSGTHLNDEIEVRPIAPSGVEVVAKKRYAFWHHEGTKPHVIFPRRARFLRFVVRGRNLATATVFAAKVNHPGTKPNKYLTTAAEAAMRRRRS